MLIYFLSILDKLKETLLVGSILCVIFMFVSYIVYLINTYDNSEKNKEGIQKVKKNIF